MFANRVTQLGYIGIEVSDLKGWEQFANGVLGLQSNGSGADGALFLRMDENHHRLALHPGLRDDVAYVGWEVPGEAALKAAGERLESHGFRVTPGSAAQAKERAVMDLIVVQDPNGVANEVYWGPLVDAAHPFRSPRAIGAFEAGRLGFGHVVLAVDSYDDSLRFYRDGLGLLISDFIELDMGAQGAATVAFLHSGPRHHSIAFAQFAAPKRLHHFMLQLRNMDDIGSTYDICQDQRIPITASLGRHTNDHMTSFYMGTPSGFRVEYGYGGREIDDDAWEVQVHHQASIWGHRPETATPLVANQPPA
jgi:2,3-dihydroxybiphenyl 1,2-dioxygenase